MLNYDNILLYLCLYIRKLIFKRKRNWKLESLRKKNKDKSFIFANRRAEKGMYNIGLLKISTLVSFRKKLFDFLKRFFGVEASQNLIKIGKLGPYGVR